MAGHETTRSKNYVYVPTRLNEAYMKVHKTLEKGFYTPLQTIIMTSEALKDAGLFVEKPPRFDIAPILDSENERIYNGGSSGVEDNQRISRRMVAELARAGVLDKEAYMSLVE